MNDDLRGGRRPPPAGAAPGGQLPDGYDRFRRAIVRGASRLAGTWGADAADLILLVPDLLRLFASLAGDPRVSLRMKAVAAGAVAYLVSPIDLLPEIVLGPLGLADDVVIAFLVLDLILNHVDERVVREHWRGEQDLLEVVQGGLRLGRRLVPASMHRRLRAWVGDRHAGRDRPPHRPLH